MPFLTRVILHGVSSHAGSDYLKLHMAMSKAGFTRQQATHPLPPAEYTHPDPGPIGAVHNKAETAANSTGLKNGVYTVQFTLSLISGFPSQEASRK
jgi:hypothetical protein